MRAFGVKRIFCAKRTPLSRAEEESFGVLCCSLEQLLAESDIVSLHLPVSAETAGMADSTFFSSMKDGSFFVNTSRGELVDDAALLNAPDSVAERLLFSPHIGGITASSFRRSYAMITEDIRDAAEGRVPKRIVNPW